MTIRKKHLNWCKKRALEYVERGDVAQAWTSIVSDLGKHESTQGHIAIRLGSRLMLKGKLNTKDEMRRFIEKIH